MQPCSKDNKKHKREIKQVITISASKSRTLGTVLLNRRKTSLIRDMQVAAPGRIGQVFRGTDTD